MGVQTILRASRLTATPAMTNDHRLSFNLQSVSRERFTAAFDGGRLSSESGVLLLALADRRRAVADTLSALIADHHDPSHITHTVADVLRARMLAIGCGYPDGNDFDPAALRSGLQAGLRRLPDSGGDLCSQPTISRWENTPTLREIIRLTYALVDLWLRSYRSHPGLLSWTSTTRSMSCTATDDRRNGTPTMMSAASCRSMSMMRQRCSSSGDSTSRQDAVGH